MQFCRFYFRVSFLLSRILGKKGTLIIPGLLGNLEEETCEASGP